MLQANYKSSAGILKKLFPQISLVSIELSIKCPVSFCMFSYPWIELIVLGYFFGCNALCSLGLINGGTAEVIMARTLINWKVKNPEYLQVESSS